MVGGSEEWIGFLSVEGMCKDWMVKGLRIFKGM